MRKTRILEKDNLRKNKKLNSKKEKRFFKKKNNGKINCYNCQVLGAFC